MNEKYDQLQTILTELAHLEKAVGVLGWDRNTKMPKGGAKARAEVVATLNRLHHERFTSDEVGKLLEALEPWAADQDADSAERRTVEYTQWAYERQTKLPADFVVERTKKLSAANQAWQTARQEADYTQFAPHMENVLDITLRLADFFKPYDHPYDVLLNQYERGMSTQQVQTLFDFVRGHQVELIAAIAEQPQVDNSFLHLHYPIDKQLKAGEEIVRAFGYDFNQGRQDETTHPFAANLGYGDQRITYRADEHFLNPYLFAIMHEAGHAMYEQGIPEALWGGILYRGTSSGVHESQSRLWENLVGRSKPFWAWYYPRLQAHFPENLGNVSLDDFYKGVNRVAPSLIRVEADEATYNLHIMLRMEIEIALLGGEFTVAELPEVWNERIHKYLGVTPEDDAQGVLQDVHWSWGLYGQFPAYALGNIIGAQFWGHIEKALPDLDAHIAKGDFKPLHGWLVDNIYQHGRKYPPGELIERISGERLNGDAYVAYLKNKFGAIYDL
jgi:carboxypeptidase Taq